MSIKSNSISFGSLGSVEVEVWEKPDVEVFAKLEGSNAYGIGASGPYDDDCHGSACTAVTLIE